MSQRMLFTCTVVILCLGVDVYAIGLIGPPTATDKAPQVSFGLEHSFSEENLELADRGVTGVRKLDNVRRNSLLGRLRVGVFEYWELFLCIGTGTLRANEIDFDGSTDPLTGMGTRVTFYRNERIELGAVFQWSIFDGDEIEFVDAVGFHARERIDVDEQHIALAAAVHMDRWRLYGGPFYYVFDGDVTIAESWRPVNQVRPDLEESSEYGGYIGGQFDLGAKAHLTIEYANTGQGWGIGIGLSRAF